MTLENVAKLERFLSPYAPCSDSSAGGCGHGGIRRRLNRRESLAEREKLDKEEARILDLLARGLSREFTNPRRVGCPDSVLLRGIAFRELRLAEVHEWLDHLGSCSPCFREFTELREQAARSSNG